MNKNFSLAKFIVITFLIFIFLDLLIGSYIYKKFIRTNFQDKDVSFILKDSIYDHKFSTSYKTDLAGWGPIRFTFCTDGNGFRSSCDNQFNNLKEFDIGFAGDSFTEAIGLNFEDSFVGIIQSELKEKKIANLAAASYSASIHYAKINYLLSDFELRKESRHTDKGNKFTLQKATQSKKTQKVRYRKRSPCPG